MPLENLQKEQFQNIMQEHISDTIGFLFDENQEFGVACDITYVKFEPMLPKEIHKSLPTVTLFMLANYSLDSASIDGNSLQFEAGFGSDNFGSIVDIPLLAIKQVFVGEYPILMNITSPIEEDEGKNEKEDSVDSMSALLNNPENARLLKKRK